MSIRGEKYLYIFVMFDLPVTTEKNRKDATQFRNFLLKDGYIMLQFSIYVRPILGEERYEKHINRLQKAIPHEGHIMCLRVTDFQFKNMSIITNSKLETRKSKKGGDIHTNQFSLW